MGSSHDAGYGCVLQTLRHKIPDLHVFVKKGAEFLLAGEPAGPPVLVHRHSYADWISLLSHGLAAPFPTLPWRRTGLPPGLS